MIRRGIRGTVTRLINWHGAVAQLGERRVRNAEVGSSILLGSTNRQKAPPRGLLLISQRVPLLFDIERHVMHDRSTLAVVRRDKYPVAARQLRSPERYSWGPLPMFDRLGK